MSKHGKKYLEASGKIDRDKLYDPKEAVSLVRQTSTTKFDATVETHMHLGVDVRHAEQQVRDVVVLPHGIGKVVRVAVFTQGEGAAAARKANADFVIDDEEGIKKIQGGWTDFDIAIATPDMMGKVGSLGRILGPRGLMPNPKAGTVVQEADLGRAIQEAKAGRVEFRTDKTANLHVPIGKVSFSEKQLYDNLASLMEAVRKAKPAAAKGNYIRRITLTSTMGPGIRLDVNMAQSMEVSE